MKLKLALEDKEMDVRIRDRFAAEGKISPKDIKKYLSDLPDEGESSYERVTDKSHKSSGSTEQ